MLLGVSLTPSPAPSNVKARVIMDIKSKLLSIVSEYQWPMGTILIRKRTDLPSSMVVPSIRTSRLRKTDGGGPGGLTTRAAESETAPRVAVIDADTSDVTPMVSIVNVALSLPAGTVTAGGTRTAA
jgi:hypothetical protein